jgi:hypothetical protein
MRKNERPPFTVRTLHVDKRTPFERQHNAPSLILQQSQSSAKGREDDRNDSHRHLTIADLLKEVDKRNLRYTPTTSRHELERMLLEHDEKERKAKANKDEQLKSRKRNKQELHDTIDSSKSSMSARQSAMNSKPNNHTSTTARSLSELLCELDRRNIRYSPTATPLDLFQLLEKNVDAVTEDRLDEKKWKNEKISEQANAEHSPRQRQSVSSSSSIPLSDLLEKLNILGIRYSPTATRRELLILLEESARNETSSVMDQTLLRSQRRRMRRARLEQQSSPSSSSVLGYLLASPIPKRATKSVAKAVHKAKILSRKANDYLFTDDDGVRDVAFEYVKRDATATSRLKRAQEARAKNIAETSAEALERKPGRPRAVQRVSQSLYVNATKQSRLPPAKPLEPSRRITEEQPASARNRSRRRSPSDSSGKRIYSPYGADSVPYKDSFDRFGDFLADSADRVMWGSFDAENITAHDATHTRKPRHWKDRLEERFDYMLGIHNDGKYYNSWTNKVEADQKKQRGNDSLSVARGRRSKRRGMPGGKKASDKAIWEQDNLISLLFGQSSSGRSNLFDKILSYNGSVLNLFSAVFKSGVIIASYLCRWASCRGALPQPIVVVGMSTAVICARPRYRFKIVAMTLIVMRAVGELLHGYVYGDEGWEDDEEVDIDDVASDSNTAI